jgi:hypothetical protein
VSKIKGELNMNASHFTDERIDEITSGKSPLTKEERQFLITDTPNLEECHYSESELSSMTDVQLMKTAYWAWADYCR